MKTCLIVKTSALGDVLQALQVARYIKEKDPSFIIHWVAETPEVFALIKRAPWVDKVIPFSSKIWRKHLWKYRREIFSFIKELRKQRYDLLFDLQGNIKSALVVFFSRAKEKVGYSWSAVAEKCSLLTSTKKIFVDKGEKIGSFYLELAKCYFSDEKPWVSPPLWLSLNPEEEKELKWLRRHLEKKPVYLCCFGSQWPHKRFLEEVAGPFIEKLAKAYAPTFIFIYHSPEEERRARALAEKIGGFALGNLSLPLLQHLMGYATWVIATDSAPLHLCTMIGTPSFGLFGPSSGKVYHPSSSFFQGSCPYGVEFVKRCPRLRICTTGACLRKASADALFQAFANENNCAEIASMIGIVSPNKGSEESSSGENHLPSVKVPPVGSAT